MRTTNHHVDRAPFVELLRKIKTSITPFQIAGHYSFLDTQFLCVFIYYYTLLFLDI